MIYCLPVTVRYLLVKCSDTGGKGLGKPDCELDMRCSIKADLQLTDCVSAAEGLMDALQPVLTHKALVVGAGVVQGANEAHTFGHLLAHFRLL